MHGRAQTWADDPNAYAGNLSTREPISLVRGLNFDDKARPAGFEPATLGLEVPCSVRLSYERMGASVSGVACRPGSVADSILW